MARAWQDSQNLVTFLSVFSFCSVPEVAVSLLLTSPCSRCSAFRAHTKTRNPCASLKRRVASPPTPHADVCGT